MQGQDHKLTEMFSLSENAAKKAIKKTPHDLLSFNENHLSRIYPNATRINSLNYNPAYFWMHGCQMVALNYQANGDLLLSDAILAIIRLMHFLCRCSNAAQYSFVPAKWRLWIYSQATRMSDMTT